MKVCRCCKSQISTQKCHNCGFINVAVLDEESEIQEQKLADEYRANMDLDKESKVNLIGILKSVEKSDAEETNYSLMNGKNEVLLKAAADGNIDAQFRLAVCFYEGYGVRFNITEAVTWFEKAAEQGHPGACEKMAHFYYMGICVKLDYAKAIEFCEKAESQGHKVTLEWYKDGGDNVRCLIEGDNRYNQKIFKEAAKWYEKSAKKGNAVAQARLGDCYCFGEGVAKDKLMAEELYKKAAENGNRMSKIALCLFFGDWRHRYDKYEITEKDIEYITNEANSGVIRAQRIIGECHFRGVGIKTNHSIARKYFDMVKSSGYKTGNEWYSEHYE